MTRSAAARRTLVAAVCLYAASVPVSVLGATAGWILAALSLIVILREEGLRPDIRVAGVEWMLAGYLAVALLCAALGFDFTHSLIRLRADANMVWVACLLAAAFALEPAPEAALAAAAGFAASALYGIGRSALYFIENHRWIMARGTVHHITWGEILTFGLLGGVSALVCPDTPLFRGRRGWVVAYCLLMGTALLFSQARGPWLACMVALATIAALRKEARPMLFAAVASTLIFFLAAPRLARPYFERFLSIFNPAEAANAVRFELWRLAVQVFRESPLTGVGPENFGLRLKVLHPGPFADTMVHTQAHDLYLHQLAERGLAGVGMLLALLGFLWWRALQRYRRAPDFRSLWLIAALTGFWVMNLTQNSLQTATVWMFVVFLWMWTMRNEAPGHRPGATG